MKTQKIHTSEKDIVQKLILNSIKELSSIKQRLKSISSRQNNIKGQDESERPKKLAIKAIS